VIWRLLAHLPRRAPSSHSHTDQSPFWQVCRGRSKKSPQACHFVEIRFPSRTPDASCYNPAPMANLDAVVKELQQERDRIDAAIKALSSLTGSRAQSRNTRPKRRLSVAGRARIIAAARARWAKVRSQKNVVPITPAGKRRKRILSPAARRKIAGAQRARWAKIKAAKR
jgi:hypothetical protein